ncbi:MAG: VCBS repeat-containing protein [Balneolaceae bacterium]|nr:VCBS repeat-containing protein [Balneolaceae bacterium]
MQNRYLLSIIGLFLLITGCRQEPASFERLSPDRTGIDFENTVEETADFNILTYEYIYNGAGVAAADFSGNGYPDLFFVGNMAENRLYLNRGDYEFEDVTSAADIAGDNRKWYSGVAVTDINNNGLPDIYISATGREERELRRNELYVNQGPDENGVPQFVEMAAEYGLDDDSFTTQAYFFDANGNGYQDLYLLTAHSASETSYTNVAAQRETEGNRNLDKLLISEWDDERQRRIFRDRSSESGITDGGYGLGVNVMDITGNGYPDLYVANDYITDDLFWINNGDGTFTDRAPELFTHYSFSAMGTDYADLNKNGLQDIYTLDMLPQINVRKMMMANPNNYRNFVNDAFRGYHPQFTRNTLQLNLGIDPDTGLPIYSETALASGVSATDWSWAVLLADFDNSGLIDIFVTNGIPRDITDKDFWSEYGRVRSVMPMEMALPKMPEVKIPNVMFRNLGTEEGDRFGVRFEEVTEMWGFEEPTYSTGAVMADLNNNGQLDLIVSNINQPAFIYRNSSGSGREETGSWLRVQLEGADHNRFAEGSELGLYSGGEKVYSYRHRLQRGYLSSVDPVVHIGLGEMESADSLVVRWPVSAEGEKRRSVISNPEFNQTLSVRFSESSEATERSEESVQQKFKEISEEVGLTTVQHHSSVNDLHNQPLLPYRHASIGPSIAVGDLSGNGLDDIFMGGSSGEPPLILWQGDDGRFSETIFNATGYPSNTNRTDSAVLIFDANGNGRQDIYIGSGGVSLPRGDSGYRDLLFLNEGEKSFRLDPEAIPELAYGTSVVAAEDISGNGLTDLFIGGDVVPGRYPESVPSTLLINESTGDQTRFTDRTEDFAPMLRDFGPVKDAILADITGDGVMELLLAADWEPVTILAKEEGRYRDITADLGLSEVRGWWFSLHAADLTGNGLTDIVAGNLGLNSGFSASGEQPVRLYHGDLTGDGFYESIPTRYLKDSDGRYREFVYQDRDDFNRQMPEAGSRVPTHQEYGSTTIHDLLTSEELEAANVKTANSFESVIFIQREEGRFERVALPMTAQSSPVFGILSSDFSGNGREDFLLAGNLSGADLQTGSYMAGKGVYLESGEDGNYTIWSPAESGFHVPGETRKILSVELYGGTGYLVSQLNAPLLLFKLKHD